MRTGPAWPPGALFPEASVSRWTRGRQREPFRAVLESNGSSRWCATWSPHRRRPAPLPHPLNAGSHAACAGHSGHQRFDPLRDVGHAYAQSSRGRQRPDLHPQSRPDPRIPAVHPLLSRPHQATLELADHIKTKIDDTTATRHRGGPACQRSGPGAPQASKPRRRVAARGAYDLRR